MDEEDPATVRSRKELRKKKLMEYLKNKGKHNYRTNINERPVVKPETERPPAPKLIRGKENKAPVTSFYHAAKKVQPLAPAAKKVQPLAPAENRKPPRKTFLIVNKENVQSERRQPTNSALIKKPTLVGTNTISTLRTTRLPQKTANIRIQPTGKVSLNFSMAKNSNGTFRSPSNLNTSSSVKTYTARLSLGPMVKTRTGLIPAIIQPRVARLVPVANAGIVPLRPAIPSSKAPVKKIPLRQRPAVPQEPKSIPFKEPPCKSKPKSRVTPLSRTLPSARLPDKVASQPAKHTSQPKSGPMAQKSGVGGRTTQTAASKKPTAAKPKMADAPPKAVSTLVAKKKASQTTVTLVSQPRLETQATKSQTVGKKMAAEQAERMKKLQEWREAKGISYKRPPMQVKPAVRGSGAPRPIGTMMKAQEDARLFIRDVNKSLSDCIKLLTEGCPASKVKAVLSRLPPVSRKFAKFWICKAYLMEQEGNLDVLPMFEEAVRVVLEPVDELRMVVFDILKKKDIKACEGEETEASHTPRKCEQTEKCKDEDSMMTPPAQILISGDTGPSSTVKYKITATPSAPPSQQREPICLEGHEVRFFTPVRRSVRIDNVAGSYPKSLREHGQCVASYTDLLATQEEEEAEAKGDIIYIYRENEALKDKWLSGW